MRPLFPISCYRLALVCVAGLLVPSQLTWAVSTSEQNNAMLTYATTASHSPLSIGVLAATNAQNAGPGSPIPTSSAETSTTSQLTQYGITWTFASPVQYGQFVNGDYWVVGPVTVASVSPGWDGARHGSMLDPVPLTVQGFDARINDHFAFSDDSRVKFPVTITGTKSLLSAISLPQNKTGGAYQALSDMAVLTIVSIAPPSGSFRPAFVAGSKKMWNIADANYARVPTLPVPAGITLPDMSNIMIRINPYFGTAAWGPAIIPENNVYDVYPAYENITTSILSLEAMLAIPQKEDYINRLVQRGIDHYAIALLNDYGWETNGGYGVGLKWPILFAGIVLGDAGMQSPPLYIPSRGNGSNIFKFPEDGYTYLGAPTAAYPNGKPMFGIDYAGLGYSLANCLSNCMARDPAGILDPENRPAGGGYRAITSPFWVGQTLAAYLMNAKALWRHDLYFDYVDRWLTEPETWFESSSPYRTDAWGYGDGSGLVQALWKTYRYASVTPPSNAVITITVE